MPKRPVRKAVGKGHVTFDGFRDKIGLTFRLGKNVFVEVSHGQWGPVSPGQVPARFFLNFHYHGDRLGAYRLNAEYTWCLYYAMLEALGEYVMSLIPADLLERMRLNPKIVVETNWAVGVADELSIYARRRGDRWPARAAEARSDGIRTERASLAPSAIHCTSRAFGRSASGTPRDSNGHTCLHSS